MRNARAGFVELVGAVLLAVIGPATAHASTSSGTEPVLEHGRWARVAKDAVGLDGASPSALVANDDSLLLVGAASVDGAPFTARIWRSEDAVHWSDADHPTTAGGVHAIAVSGDRALAIGGTGLDGSDFVWRSDDGGRTWAIVARGSGVFGAPAPEMGRPFVDGLASYRGWWVASGGRSDGYAGVWVSRDGESWREVLGLNTAGGTVLVAGADDSLLAYWSTFTWTALDPTKWRGPHDATVPGRFFLSSIAPGATAAVGESYVRHGQPTPLLHSKDGGPTWIEDERFLEQFPDASVQHVTRVGPHLIAAGWSVTPPKQGVAAWISTDGRKWKTLPDELVPGPGGMLSLIAELDGRVVLFGTAPELLWYYSCELPE